MTGLTSRSNGDQAPAGTGRGRTWRRFVGLLLGGVSVSFGIGLATAPGAAAVQCPGGAILLGNLCISFGPTPTSPTTTPAATPPTTSAPVVQLPPVTLPPVTVPPVLNPSAAPVVPEAAQRLLDLANAERRNAGLGGLSSRDDIVAIALAHSQQMAQAGDLFHSDSFFGSAVKNLLNAAVRGENVAYNGDIDNTHARLMASPGHRANLLDARFSVVGFGVVKAADGRYFVTQNFIQPAGAPRAAATPRLAPTAASRQAPVPTTATPQPATTVATTPPTTAAAPVAPPVAAPAEAAPAPSTVLHAVSTATSATPLDHTATATSPLAGTAAVLLGGTLAACCVVPRRYGLAAPRR